MTVRCCMARCHTPIGGTEDTNVGFVGSKLLQTDKEVVFGLSPLLARSAIKVRNRFDRRATATRPTEGSAPWVRNPRCLRLRQDAVQASRLPGPTRSQRSPGRSVHRLLTYMTICLSAAHSRYVLIQERCLVDRTLTAPRQGPRLH